MINMPGPLMTSKEPALTLGNKVAYLVESGTAHLDHVI